MGTTRDLFKNIRDTKGKFPAKMGTIKGRNGIDLKDAEDIKKRWQEYTEELQEKGLHDPDNHDGMITHLEPDILECEVKWALGRITMNKASGGDEQIQRIRSDRLPEELWTEVHNIVQQAVIKTIPKREKCKKAKWLSEEALQIVEERREVKDMGEREEYAQLNAEFQRRARRVRRPSSVNNAKKQGKTEQELLEISSRKLGVSREYFIQR